MNVVGQDFIAWLNLSTADSFWTADTFIEHSDDFLRHDVRIAWFKHVESRTCDFSLWLHPTQTCSTSLHYSYQRGSKPMKLRRNELCPIHGSRFCCGRAEHRSNRKFWTPVRRIEDPHHPRGYRELRSPAEMKRLLNRKIVSQNGKCGICKRSFSDYSEIVPDHIHPRGLGGGKRDDHPDNIQAVHRSCNFNKGSRRRTC